MRNKEMDLLKSIGIIYVVGTHYYLPLVFLYPIASFLLPLFFFISGYFFKPTSGFRMKWSYCTAKTRELILPYLVYQVVFTIICYVLKISLSIDLILTYWKMDLLQYPLILLLEPLFGGISTVFVASWFVTDLWIVLIIIQFIYYNKRNDKRLDFFYFISFLAIALICITWSKTSPRSTMDSSIPNTLPFREHTLFKRIFIRASFSLFFVFCGNMYRRYIEKYQNLLFTRRIFFIAIIILWQLTHYYRGNINFHHFNAEYNAEPVWLPIITSIIGIYIHLFIAKYLSKNIDNKNLLLTIGRETYHIMCQHMLWFLFLNIITIAFFQNGNFQVLSSNISYKKNRELNWPIYVGSGLLIPTYLAIYYRKFNRKKLVRMVYDAKNETGTVQSV